MRTAIVSDIHLGAGADSDLLRRREALDVLLGAIDGADRLILLGDIVEMRDRPFTDAMQLAAPVLREIAKATDGEIVVVPGNHDHRLVGSWLETREATSSKPLGLADRGRFEGWVAKAFKEGFGERKVRMSYPGFWVRKDVYATHGHYLDRHLTIPTFERLGLAVVERTLGLAPAPTGDPLEAPGSDPDLDDPGDYERVSAPIFAFLFALAQAGARESHPGGTPTKRIWDALSGGSSRSAKLRGWLLGSVALPGAVGMANRLGIGPVRADLSPTAITRAGVDGMGEVAERLGIEAEHLIFGHTHRRGPLPHEDQADWRPRKDGPALWNTGSWVHSPGLLRSTAKHSAYWPGTIAMVGDEGPPELHHLLEDWSRDDLAGDGGEDPEESGE